MAKTWKDRLAKETSKLEKKLRKLSSFIGEEDGAFDALPQIDRSLLIIQNTAMATYANVLRTRMEIHDIDDCECEEIDTSNIKVGSIEDFVNDLLTSAKEEDGRNS